ncbi:LOW QUALITY PROTEIN: Multicopper oxidase, C-terminal [Dillenia turbinata]|uniref:Multicopper oxidase, C-terminal n=1 Tax=Dillenia turbinata TaxID=194707 RepID=A0AAN8W095_9MAGN
MATRPYVCGAAAFDNSTAAGILEYEQKSHKEEASSSEANVAKTNDTDFAISFGRRLRSLNTPKFPAKVPETVDGKFYFTVGLGLGKSSKSKPCQGANNTRLVASVNNVTFVQPNTSLLQAHFSKQSNGVYTTDFLANPPYTGTPPKNLLVSSGTKVVVLPFNTKVKLVLQDTSIIGAESHPLHLHGFNFFVVGWGFGNYDPNNDPKKFNLVDPAERSTIGVPAGGWVAIRFIVDNPGVNNNLKYSTRVYIHTETHTYTYIRVWFMRCHLEVHTSRGLKTAWLEMDGTGPKLKLPSRTSDLPKC